MFARFFIDRPIFATVVSVVIVVVGIAAWTQSQLWLPRSLWFLGLLARAWKVVLA